MRIEFSNRNGHLASSRNPMTWAWVLRGLKDESGLDYAAPGFDKWVLEEWNIKLLHDESGFPSHITGMELDEPTLTMLMLKFPRAFA